jgi:ribosome-binding protein aMBF1 (putative translation factor)
MIMDAKKRRRLEAAGWKVGSAAELLDLTPEEATLIDLKLSLGRLVRRARRRANLSQQRLADKLSSSQSRVAKLEAGDPSVSLDLMVKAALAAGARKTDLARAIVGKSARHAPSS